MSFPRFSPEQPTPFYFYDLDLLRRTLRTVNRYGDDPRFRVHYAVKANANPVILREVVAAGLGADCVSGGEIQAAIDAGIAPAKITYAGVGKTDAEIELGLRAGIGCFNVESVPELEVINEIALRLGVKADIALRVNPDIDAHTHEYITTGLAENKFGIDRRMLDNVVDKALSLKGVNLIGLHFHIGSQITINEPFSLLCQRINDLLKHFAERDVNFRLINVGGGLGIDYDDPDANPVPDFKGYFDTFRSNLDVNAEIHFELGRSIVAQCGSLIARVLYVKEGIDKKFVIVDAGMTDLIRPALYNAYHKIENITSTAAETDTYDVVGPVCESSDVFGKNRVLPITQRGDLIAFRSAGAYGEAMASRYNLRPLAPTVTGI